MIHDTIIHDWEKMRPDDYYLVPITVIASLEESILT